MMPIEKTAALCKQTALLVKQSMQELAKLQEGNLLSEDYIETARAYLEAASWAPLSTREAYAGPAFASPAVSGNDGGWSTRAQETRFFAASIVDAAAKRAMLEIADCYDRLGGCSASLLPGAAQRRPRERSRHPH